MLEHYDLRVAVQDSLALVEMEMVFRNPEPRVIEGHFQYLLPSGATISRFAKEVDGSLMEGEVLPRPVAHKIYNEILHENRDPALLEQQQGNRFSAKVFPIPASGTTRLLLSFSRRLPLVQGTRRLTIPMQGIPAIGKFEFKGVARLRHGETLAEEHLQDYDSDDESIRDGTLVRMSRSTGRMVPQADLTIEVRSRAESNLVRVHEAGEFCMISARPSLVDSKEGQDACCELFIDTSASNAGIERRRNDAIEALLAASAGRIASIRSFAFDLDVVPLGSQDESDGYVETINALRGRNTLGPTDLGKLLETIGNRAREAPEPQRFILVSDGIPTIGKLELRELLAALGEWPGNDSLYTLAMGNVLDASILEALPEGRNGRFVHCPLEGDLREKADQALAELLAPPGPTLRLELEGAEWFHPREFHDVKEGDELVAFARTRGQTSVLPRFTQVGLDGTSHELSGMQLEHFSADSIAPLIEREAWRANLDLLAEQERLDPDPASREGLRQKQLETSVLHRVLCSQTALLVLESEADYQRFGVDRRALADILTVGSEGIEWVHRRKPGAGASFTPPAEPPVITIPTEDRSSPRPSKGNAGSDSGSWTLGFGNLLRSRMAANESAGIAACKTYAEAQDIYRRTDWDGDGILEYAQSVSGQDSLYEKTAGMGDLQLVDQAFANATVHVETMPPLPEPTQRQKAEFDRLVGQFGATTVAKREEAYAFLERLGPCIVKLLREHAAQSGDPATRTRCRSLASKLVEEFRAASVVEPAISLDGVSPKAGYCFMILKGQGSSAAGGAKSYVSGENMTTGYALLAFPHNYDGGGRTSFIINNTGTVYQKDLGENTLQAVQEIVRTGFNPDKSWVIAE